MIGVGPEDRPCWESFVFWARAVLAQAAWAWCGGRYRRCKFFVKPSARCDEPLRFEWEEAAALASGARR